ncbi:hypothetical protein SLS62_008399 [Diatrype stigma]|uniref:O-methyltransferase dimerisation domain-containing protein n=1 Tax=Diatrype stigma TaxID=117547 RepID=A0AAN9ULQ3_9PEZI
MCYDTTRSPALASRTAIDLKIFETAVQDDGRPKTDAELAAPTGASPTLTKRIARVCVSMGMLGEAGPGLYVPNSLTRLLAQPDYAAGIIFLFVFPCPCPFLILPAAHICVCVCLCLRVSAADLLSLLLLSGESFDYTQLSFAQMPT